MTLGGWTFLVLSWGCIIIAVSYCMCRVLKKKR